MRNFLNSVINIFPPSGSLCDVNMECDLPLILQDLKFDNNNDNEPRVHYICEKEFNDFVVIYYAKSKALRSIYVFLL